MSDDLVWELQRRYDLGERDFASTSFPGQNFHLRHFQKINLNSANLRDANFHAAILDGANLAKANLAHSNFYVAELKEADLSGANLTHASFERATLSGANLINAVLEYADLREANLKGADLRRARLTGAKLQNADLSEAVIDYEDIKGVNLLGSRSRSLKVNGYSPPQSVTELVERYTRGERFFPDLRLPAADLSGTVLAHCTLNGADFRNAVLVHTNLDGCDLQDITFDNVDLSKTQMRGADLSGSSLCGATIAWEDLILANLTSAKCEGLTAIGYIAPASVTELYERYSRGERYFSGARLANADFSTLSRDKYGDSSLRHIKLDEAILRGCNLSRIDFTGASLMSADLRGANCAFSNFEQAHLSGAKLEGANFTNSYLKETRIRIEDLRMIGLVGAGAELADVVGYSAPATREELEQRYAAGERYFCHIKLDGQMLAGINLDNAQLRGCSFRSADLTRAKFNGADLASVDLTGACCEGAEFKHAQLTGAKLEDISLVSASLFSAECSGADFKHADLRDSDLTNVVMERANVETAMFHGALMDPVALKKQGVRFGETFALDLQNREIPLYVLIISHKMDIVEKLYDQLAASQRVRHVSVATSFHHAWDDIRAGQCNTIIVDPTVDGRDLTERSIFAVREQVPDIAFVLMQSPKVFGALKGRLKHYFVLNENVNAKELPTILEETLAQCERWLRLQESKRHLRASLFEYDVALSFAGEDRGLAEQLAKILRLEGIRVFYDDFEKAELWGKNLYSHLHDVYEQKARYCVMFASKAYASKVWTSHEREAAQERALVEKGEYILPIRIDNTKIPGLPSTVAYVPIEQGIPAIAALLLRKLESVLGRRRQSSETTGKK